MEAWYSIGFAAGLIVPPALLGLWLLRLRRRHRRELAAIRLGAKLPEEVSVEIRGRTARVVFASGDAYYAFLREDGPGRVAWPEGWFHEHGKNIPDARAEHCSRALKAHFRRERFGS